VRSKTRKRFDSVEKMTDALLATAFLRSKPETTRPTVGERSDCISTILSVNGVYDVFENFLIPDEQTIPSFRSNYGRPFAVFRSCQGCTSRSFCRRRPPPIVPVAFIVPTFGRDHAICCFVRCVITLLSVCHYLTIIVCMCLPSVNAPTYPPCYYYVNTCEVVLLKYYERVYDDVCRSPDDRRWPFGSVRRRLGLRSISSVVTTE